MGLGGYDVILQFAKSAVDALTLPRLAQQASPIDQHDDQGCHYQIRYSRPALTFSEDTPDMVRLGLAVEGGIALPSGRILSLDAFITTTTAPHLVQRPPYAFIGVDFKDVDFGELQISYLGRPVPVDGAGLATDLPSPSEMAEIRHQLRTMIEVTLDQMPPLPLSYGWLATDQDVEETDIHVRPESRRGGALMVGRRNGEENLEEAAAIPLCVTPQQNTAVLISPTLFAEAFAATATVPALPNDGWVATHLTATCADRAVRLALTVAPIAPARLPEGSLADTMPRGGGHATTASGAVAIILPDSQPLPVVGNIEKNTIESPAADLVPVTIQVDVRPLILEGPWDLLVDEVRVLENLAPDHPALALAEAARADEPLRQHLAGQVQRAVAQVLSTIWHGGADDPQIWHLAAWDEADEALPPNFAPVLVYGAGGGLAASGAIPAETIITPPEDAASFIIRSLRDPIPTEDGAIYATVMADAFLHMAKPYDLNWISSLAGSEVPESHAATVRFRLTRPDPPATGELPRRTRSRPLPPGFVLLTATAVDGFGRVARADRELDLSPFQGWSALLPAIPGPSEEELPQTGERHQRREHGWLGMRQGVTQGLERLDAATRILPVSSPAWSWLAIALSMLAVVVSILTILLIRPGTGASSSIGFSPTATSFSTPISLPTATIGVTTIPNNVATATPQPTLIPVATTPTGPQTYGRFAVDPVAAVFSCHTTTNTPITLQVTNVGTETVNWSARAIEQVGGEAWAAIAPMNGILNVGKTVTVTVSPVPGSCSLPDTMTFKVQFTAPNTVPLTVTVTHD